MQTVLDFLGVARPDNLDGRLLPPARREYAVGAIPFSNPGDPARSVDNVRRRLQAAQATAATAGDLSPPGQSHLIDFGISNAVEYR